MSRRRRFGKLPVNRSVRYLGRSSPSLEQVLIIFDVVYIHIHNRPTIHVGLRVTLNSRISYFSGGILYGCRGDRCFRIPFRPYIII